MSGVKFLRLLLTVLFVAMGVLGLLLTAVFMYGIAEVTTETLLTIMLSVGFIIAGYGLYTGAKWGWILAALFTILNIITAYLAANTFSIILHLIILTLLLLTAREYTVPVPLVKTPHTFIETREYKFVKKK